MQPLKILDRETGIERLLDKRGPAAGNQKENQRALIAPRQPIENGAAGREAFFIRYGMSSDENFHPVREARAEALGNDQNSVGSIFGRKNCRQALGHAKDALPNATVIISR